MAEETTKIDVGGHELRYRLSGEGDRVLVLLHGFAETIDVWDGLRPYLAGLGRILLLEQRAHGWSGAPTPPFHWKDLAEDVLKALDGLGIAKADFVGHGLGGIVALQVVGIAPARVSSLVMIGDATNSDPAQQNLFDEIVKSGQMNGLEGIAHAIFGPISRQKVEGHPTALTEIARLVQGLAGTGVTRDLAAVSVRTLCLSGAEDAAWPERIEGIATQIEGASSVSVDGAGADVLAAKPSELAEQVKTFIQASS